MPGHLPLNAFRVFEAAARHLSFTRAARELNVTQAAVSHQIKALEAYLKVQLFQRFNRSLGLTEDGRKLVIPVRDSLERLERAVEHIHSRGTQRLTVSILPSFATKWLVPRLGRFRQAHPEIDILISPSIHTVDFSREPVDVALRYGLGRYAGLRTTFLFSEDVFPVCSPKLLDGTPPLRHPDDLRLHTLLHDDGPDEWRMWLKAVKVHGIEPDRGPMFTDSAMLIQAALDGQGVALGRSVLVAHDLAAGRLVRPFAISSLSRPFAYYAVAPEATADRPKVVAFREWLLSEARLTPTTTEPPFSSRWPVMARSGKAIPHLGMPESIREKKRTRTSS
ncbi:MAG: transcriptional regulator GcvA [Rhodospirillales bacterium]|nr:transcriptional regulator GcvA [Rhodospirillales bacterium]